MCTTHISSIAEMFPIYLFTVFVFRNLPGRYVLSPAIQQQARTKMAARISVRWRFFLFCPLGHGLAVIVVFHLLTLLAGPNESIGILRAVLSIVAWLKFPTIWTAPCSNKSFSPLKSTFVLVCAFSQKQRASIIFFLSGWWVSVKGWWVRMG